MNEPAQTIRDEPRWTPALAILVVLFLLTVLPHHVRVMPVWVFHVAATALLVAMAAVALTPTNTLWRRIERMLIMLLAVAYIANTIVELVDMIGVITLHPSKSNAFSLASARSSRAQVSSGSSPPWPPLGFPMSWVVYDAVGVIPSQRNAVRTPAQSLVSVSSRASKGCPTHSKYNFRGLAGEGHRTADGGG